MRKKLLLFSTLVLFCFMQTFAQQGKTVTGTVTSSDGTPLGDASITVVGQKTGVRTAADGSFSIDVPSKGKYLQVSFVGYESQRVDITDFTRVKIVLQTSSQALSDVVIIGYGSAKRKDLSGSYSTVTSKNFNVVPTATPDQLLQGKVAGLLVTVGSGAPGSATEVRIRGNNSIRAGTNPLYVVDGVPLDGRSARPSFNLSGLGTLPDANPLTYLNASDIENITVLKDASASAIYGSRGANGVILITTRTSSSGPLKIDVSSSWSTNGLMKQPDILDAGQYRTALAKYGAKSDSGASYKPFDKILQHKLSQNYNISFSGGNSENSRWRASLTTSSTPGIIRKSELDKYIANVNGSYKFLDKKLTITFGVITANTHEQIAPVANDPGSTGSIVSNAMQWNPTLVMERGPHNYTVNPNGQVNPLAFSDGYNDYANVTTVLGNITAAYKITPDLEYKFVYGGNYSNGARNAELLGFVSGTGGNNTPNSKGQGGIAIVANSTLFTQSLNHTLTYHHEFNDLDFTGLVGYEYGSTAYKTQNTSVYGFDYNNSASNLTPIHLYDNMQDGLKANLSTASSNDPSSELQSYFARVQFNYKDKYNITASFRSDGSSNFGSNNKYAYFPAVSGKWTISQEDFMKGSKIINNLALRVGWGKTGNQSFPAGAALNRYQYTSTGSLSVINFANPNLKWETVTASNFGLDFGLWQNRLTGTIEAFFKKTTNPLFPGTYPTPAPGGTLWQNLPGYVSNKGGELNLEGVIIQTKDFSWSVGGTLTYVRNKFVYPQAGNAPLVLTGQLNGKGTSATWVQSIANGQPIDVFFLRKFSGFDQNGFAITTGAAQYAGDPNPRYIVGLNTELDYKKWALTINMHGAYDYVIYNNTLQSVTGLGFINNGSNIAKTLIGTPENPANPVSASTRYLQSGNYMKMGNATIRYRVGDVGKKVIKNLNLFVSGSNIFVITKYPGFDPEVNVSKADQNGTGIPSIGIDYVGYPTVRSFTFGLNFSIN